MNRKLSLLALGVAVALGGCSTNNNNAVPPTQQTADLSKNVLQFAVGTANLSGAGPATIGLNTVVTYRQPNGLDGTLLNTPTITGPAGFVNNKSTGFDGGTNTIAGSPQPPVGVAAQPSTFGSTGGAFAYGFQPDNSTTTGAVSFSRFSLPFFPTTPAVANVTVTARQFIGGPPAYPNVRNGTEPTNPNTGVPFQGYPMGFTDFNLTPVAGTYSLALVVPTGFAGSTPTSTTVTAAATLSTLVALPPFPTPTIAFNGTGGATVTAVVPPGVTEAFIVIRDAGQANGNPNCYPGSEQPPAYYTFRTTTTGVQTFTLPDTIGPTFSGQPVTPSICTSTMNTATFAKNNPTITPTPAQGGDAVTVYAVGFNYGAFAAGPPNSSSPTPTIVGANGQADLTQSATRSATSP